MGIQGPRNVSPLGMCSRGMIEICVHVARGSYRTILNVRNVKSYALGNLWPCNCRALEWGLGKIGLWKDVFLQI